jgi:hypothetical protein
VTDQVYEWLKSGDARESLQAAGLTAGCVENLTADLVYMLVHMNLPKVYDISFLDSGQPSEFIVKLLAAMCHGEEVPWILHAGCFYGFTAMICAMYECYLISGRFKVILTVVLAQCDRTPENVTRPELPGLMQTLLHTVPAQYITLFDEAVRLAQDGQDFHIDTCGSAGLKSHIT